MRQDEPFTSTKFPGTRPDPQPDGPGPQPDDPGPQPQPLNGDPRYKGLVHVDQFMADMVPPSYIVDGIIQRGYTYSLTGLTIAGKTAICLLLASCVARGEHLGGREVPQGGVLFLAGENTANVQYQWFGLSDALGIQSGQLPLYFHKGAFTIELSIDSLARDVSIIPNLTLVIVDSHQAFFSGANDNDNVQACAAARLFREFNKLSGNPTVIIICHPIKGARRDAMVPRGGSAFLNEVDGNLALWRVDDVTELYECGKHRGAPYEPMSFRMIRTEPTGLVDQQGRQMPATVAKALLEVEIEKAVKESERRENRALAEFRRNPALSERGLADALECTRSVARSLKKRLRDELRWIKKRGRAHILTDDGEAVLHG